jgi:hypothetical protein
LVNRRRFDVIVDFDPRTEHARGCSVSSKPVLDAFQIKLASGTRIALRRKAKRAFNATPIV